jgi:murein DD-endopeptidase MepM/ murein hydrolase activator NlpD
MTRKLSRRSFGKALGTAATVLAVPTVLSGTASAFSDGDHVTPTANLNTRYRPGLESRVLATMSPGTEGEIMNGPVNEDGYTWWGVHWLADDIWGWSAGEYLELTSGGGGGGDVDFTWPISGIVTSPYGSRNGGFHGGVDIDGGGIGEPIYAARAGVAYQGYDPGGYGNFVYIDHDGGYLTEYGHVNSFGIADGEYVERGEYIAGMGSTGNSTGPHLHISIERNNNVRPIPASDGEYLTAGDPIPRDYSGI